MIDDKLNLTLPTKIDMTNRFQTIPKKAGNRLPLQDLIKRRKQCLTLWIETGSIGRGRDKYLQETGIKISTLTFRKSAIEFVVFHAEEARPIYQKAGLFLDTTEGNTAWLWHVVNIAVRLLRSKQDFIRWAIQKGYYKPAFNLFKETYNLEDSDINAFDDIIK